MEPGSEPFRVDDPSVVAALHQAGWAAGRQFDSSTWLDMLENAGFEINGQARCAWSEFGDLTIRSSESRAPASSLRIDPVDACIDSIDEFIKLRRELALNYSPLGMWSVQFRAYIGSNGKVIAIGPKTMWNLGDSLVEALSFIVNGNGSGNHAESVEWF